MRFTTTTGGAAPGLSFNAELDELHTHMVFAA